MLNVIGGEENEKEIEYYVVVCIWKSILKKFIRINWY